MQMHYFNTSSAYVYVAVGLLGVFSIVEIFRIYLGYCGNMLEHLPELSGFFILTTVPQLMICVYFVAFQRFWDTTFPMEWVLNSFYLVFLLAEMIASYLTVKKLIRHQATSFLLAPAQDVQQRITLTQRIE